MTLKVAQGRRICHYLLGYISLRSNNDTVLHRFWDAVCDCLWLWEVVVVRQLKLQATIYVQPIMLTFVPNTAQNGTLQRVPNVQLS